MYRQIETLRQMPGRRQTVFCAIHTVAQPYLHYNQIPKSQRGINIPLALMIMRWDGYIGFPGGNVDPNETLTEALVREMKEEINYDLNPFAIEPLASFTDLDETVNIHCWTHEVTPDMLREIIAHATEGEHFLAESQGCFGVQIAEFENNKGFCQFRKHNFKATAGMELDVLVKKLGVRR